MFNVHHFSSFRLFFFLSFVVLLIVPSTVSSRQLKDRKDDPKTQEYLSWLITGKGKKPNGIPREVYNNTRPSTNREEVGELLTEMNYHQSKYPNNSEPTPEQRIQSLMQAQSMDDDDGSFKQRSTSAPPSQWTLRGPVGMQHRCGTNPYYAGRVTSLNYNTTDGLYVGAAKGGLWQPLFIPPFFVVLVPITEKLPSQASGGVAVHPADPNLIFFGTGDYGTQLGGGGTGVYKSTDRGASWNQITDIAPTPTKVSRVLIAPWDDSLIFVSSDAGIFRSTNRGDSWTREATWDASDLTTSQGGTVLLAGRASSGVYRSTDEGDTWQPLSLSLSGPVGYITLAVAPSNADRAYVQVAKPVANGSATLTGQVLGVYRSDNVRDATPTWTNITPVPDSQKSYMYGQGWYHNCIAIHPTNSGRVWIGGGALLKTTNSGTSWIPVTNFPHADLKVIYYRLSDQLLYIGGDGGLFTSDDDGASWSSVLNSLLPTTMFYNIDVGKSNDDVVFGSSQDNATEGTAPGNRTKWWMSNIADGIDATVDWNNPTTVFATTQYGDVFRSTNGGDDCLNPPVNHWPWLNNGLQKTSWSAYMYQDPSNANYIYYNGNMTLYWSSNQGTNWNVANATPTTAAIKKIAVNSDGSFIYCVTGNNAQRIVGYTKSGGSPPTYTFSNLVTDSLPSGEPRKVITSLSNSNRAYLLFNGVSSNRRIMKTTNKGTSWSNPGIFTPTVAVNDLVESPNNSNILWLATDQGVYKSINGGSTWWWWNKGMPAAVIVNDMEYAYSGSGDYIVAGTFGRSTYERDVNAPLFYLTDLGIITISISSWRNFVISTSYSGSLSKSVDGGNNWATISTPTTYTINKAYLFDSLKHIIVGQFGTMMLTEDGGVNWSPLDPATQVDLRDVYFTTPLDGFAVGDNGTLLRTTDGGDIWTQAIQNFQGRLYSIMFTDYYTGFACGVDSSNTPTRVLYRTYDAGQSWNPVFEASGSGIFYDVFFTDWKTGYCTMDNGNILKTTDYGYTWEEIQTGRQYPLYSCYFADARRGWACGAMGTVLSTTDGGTTWTPDEAETSDDLYALTLVNDNLLIGSGSGILSRQIEQPASLSFTMKERWNLVSVPLTLNDYSKYSIFPNSASDAFAFDDRYYAEEILANGKGYWLKFFYEDNVSMNGFLRDQEIIEVKEGWNLIGSLSNSIPADGIQTDPEGIIESQVYGYSEGYFNATSIEPAKGYWVKVNQNGKLLLNSNPYHLTDSAGYFVSEGARAIQKRIEQMNTLTITDKSGNKQKLFFSTVVEKPSLMKRFEMPPLPPEGAFDVRFATGTMAECASSDIQRTLPLHVKSSAYPLTMTWDIQQQSSNAYVILGEKRISLSKNGSATLTDENTKILLALDKGIDPTLPKEFALHQNYPNPFNPVTVIRYQLSVNSSTTLKVFDVLGREVITLVNEVKEAGEYTVQWNASIVPSGLYFYRLSAQGVNGKSFNNVKKMLLIR